MLRTICFVSATLMGLAIFANGTTMLNSPEEWYLVVPGVTMTGPHNYHFIRDIGIVFLFVGGGFSSAPPSPDIPSPSGAY